MELRKFIASALCDIIGGVQDAQQVAPNGAIIPKVSSSFQSVETGISDIAPVEFEVTVTADEHAGGEAKLSVVAALVGGVAKGQLDTASGHVARLTFRVPVKYPR